MKKNIKTFGRVIRGLVGLVIIALGFYYQSWWGAIGFFPIFEAVAGWCALRHVCGNKECGDK